MADKNPVTVFWFRRDLRLEDNAGLYHALKSGNPVLPFFIFDKEILDDLKEKDDARVTFIYQTIEELRSELKKHNSGLVVAYDKPEHAWNTLIKEYNIAAVYTNHDYEPYAKDRDEATATKLKKHDIEFKTFKDQV
ncbi:MAG: deoxyribodipyrimidine photo-lyase, partial [Sphingobacteriales bacterium]